MNSWTKRRARAWQIALDRAACGGHLPGDCSPSRPLGDTTEEQEHSCVRQHWSPFSLRCSSARCWQASTSGGASADRKSVVSGKSVSVRVDLGGRRSIKKKKK